MAARYLVVNDGDGWRGATHYEPGRQYFEAVIGGYNDDGPVWGYIPYAATPEDFPAPESRQQVGTRTVQHGGDSNEVQVPVYEGDPGTASHPRLQWERIPQNLSKQEKISYIARNSQNGADGSAGIALNYALENGLLTQADLQANGDWMGLQIASQQASADRNDIGDFVGDALKVAVAPAAFMVGGATGAAAATGNIDSTEQLTDYLALDAAGLGAGALGAGALGAAAPEAATAAELTGSFGGFDSAALAGSDMSITSATDSMLSDFLGGNLAETATGVSARPESMLVAQSGSTMTDVGAGLLGDAAPSMTDPLAAGWEGAVADSATQNAALELANAGAGGGGGLLNSAANWVEKHPVLTVAGLQLGGSVLKGIGDSNRQENQQSHERELFERRIEAARQAEEDKRAAIQSGSYFDPRLRVRPGADRVLRRPDGTPVYGPRGLLQTQVA